MSSDELEGDHFLDKWITDREFLIGPNRLIEASERTLLECAILQDDLRVISALVERYPSIMTQFNRESHVSLPQAFRFANFATVLHLFRLGASFPTSEHTVGSLIWSAAFNPSHEVLSWAFDQISQNPELKPFLDNILTETRMTGTKNWSFGTLLHYVALEGSLEKMKACIGVGSDFLALTNASQSVMEFAVESGNIQAASYLLSLGAILVRPERTSAENNIVLNAVASKKLEMVKWVFEQAPDIWNNPILRFYRQQGLKMAIRYGSIEIAKYMIEVHGAILVLPHQNKKSSTTCSSHESNCHAPHQASSSSDNTVGNSLCSTSSSTVHIDDDLPCESLLLPAVQWDGNEEMLEWLCEQGVPTDCRTHPWYVFPIATAIVRCSRSYIGILMRYGASLDYMGAGMDPPFFSAVLSDKGSGSDLLQILTEQYGPNLHARSTADKRNILHRAAQHGHIAAAQFLCEIDPSLAHEQDIRGNTPLHVAADGKNVEIVKILVSIAHADPNALNSAKMSPIGIACKLGIEPMALVMCEHGADVDRVEEGGISPLERLQRCTDVTWFSTCSSFSLLSTGFVSNY